MLSNLVAMRLIFKFYRRNISKFLSVLICTLLGIILVYSAQMVMKSVTHSVYSVMVGPRESFTIVKGFYEEPETLMEWFGDKGNIEKVIPLSHYVTTVNMTVGGYLGANILGVQKQDMEQLMSRLNMKIIQGRAPEEDKNEILMHVHCAAKKRLKVGDEIGGPKGRNEWLPGVYKVVGLVDGDSMVSFIPFIDNKCNGLIFIPAKGRLEQMNLQLSKELINCDVMTYVQGLQQYHATIESSNMVITVIGLMVTIIVSIFIGLLCHIFFSQRKSEFGVFLAIGYPRQHILYKLFVEIISINIIALMFGMALSLLVGHVLNITVSLPRGEPIPLFHLTYVLSALCVPVYSIIFSIVLIWRMLKNLEPISIIEGI